MSLNVTARGVSSDKTTATSQVCTPTSNYGATGSLAVLAIAYDNAGASGADPYSSISDSIGNTWTSRQNFNRTAASAANDGVSLRVFTTPMNVGLLTSSTNVTVSFGAVSVAAAVWAFWEILSTDTVGTIAYVTGNGVTGTGTTFTETSTSVANENAIIGFMGLEFNSSGADDTDTTNGSWSTGQATNTTGSSSATNIGIRTQSKVVTAAGTQTYNFTVANSDWAGAWIEVNQVGATTRQPIHPISALERSTRW